MDEALDELRSRVEEIAREHLRGAGFDPSSPERASRLREPVSLLQS